MGAFLKSLAKTEKNVTTPTSSWAERDSNSREINQNHPTRELLEEFIANQDSVTTKQVYSYELRKFFSFVGKMDMKELTQRDILVYKESISSFKPATIAWKLCAIRQFMEFVYKRGHLAKNLGEGIKAPRVHQKESTCLDLLEARALLNAPDRRTSKGKRDYAILHLMLSTGVRLSELIGSKVGDLGTKYNKPVLEVLGKGKKPRTLKLAHEVRGALSDYLLTRKEPGKADYVFVTTPKRGVELQKLSPRGIQKMIGRYAKLALIQKNVTPHTLRHTAASLELEAGADIMAIKNQLGHSSISVTQRYLHTQRDALDRHPLYNEQILGGTRQ